MSASIPSVPQWKVLHSMLVTHVLHWLLWLVLRGLPYCTWLQFKCLRASA